MRKTLALVLGALLCLACTESKPSKSALKRREIVERVRAREAERWWRIGVDVDGVTYEIDQRTLLRPVPREVDFWLRRTKPDDKSHPSTEHFLLRCDERKYRRLGIESVIWGEIQPGTIMESLMTFVCSTNTEPLVTIPVDPQRNHTGDPNRPTMPE
jgi:hypothetical protein